MRMYQQETILLLTPASDESCFALPRHRRRSSLLSQQFADAHAPNISTINYSDHLPLSLKDPQLQSTRLDRIDRKKMMKKISVHKLEMSLPMKQLNSPRKTNKVGIRRGQFDRKNARQVKQLKTIKAAKAEAERIKQRLDYTIKERVQNRYEFLEVIGEGSFGVVYKGYDHQKKEQVAIKMIRTEPKCEQMSEFELNLLVTIRESDPKDQKSIIRVKDFFNHRGHLCIVTELLSINLYEMLRTIEFRGMPLDVIRKISIQVFTGLAFLKSLRIIHGDLKPENIVLKEFNKTGIKIIDFGTSTFSYERHYDYLMSRFYRAPQVILGYPYDQKIDMWSLGCVLAELYLGRPLFPGEDEFEQIGYFVQTLGLPSSEMLEISSKSNKFFTDEGDIHKDILLVDGNKVQIFNRSLKSQIRDLDFEHFLSKILTWSPNDRLAPEDALLDHWVIEDFPKQLRHEHIRNVKRIKESISHNSSRSFKTHILKRSQVQT